MSATAKRRFVADLICVGGALAFVAGMAIQGESVQGVDMRIHPTIVTTFIEQFYPPPGLVGNLG